MFPLARRQPGFQPGRSPSPPPSHSGLPLLKHPPLVIFGTMPPITSVIANVTNAGTHYSTVTTTTCGGTSDHDVHVTDYDSFDSKQAHDTPPRRRRETDRSRGHLRRSGQDNTESWRPTNPAYEERIRAFEEEIAQMKRDTTPFIF